LPYLTIALTGKTKQEKGDIPKGKLLEIHDRRKMIRDIAIGLPFRTEYFKEEVPTSPLLLHQYHLAPLNKPSRA
jgi:hypothetical protein